LDSQGNPQNRVEKSKDRIDKTKKKWYILEDLVDNFQTANILPLTDARSCRGVNVTKPYASR